MIAKVPLFLYLSLFLLLPNGALAKSPAAITLEQFGQVSTPSKNDDITLTAYLVDSNLLICQPCPPDATCDYCPPPALTLANEAGGDSVTVLLHKIPHDIKVEKGKQYRFHLRRYKSAPKSPGHYYDLLSARPL